MEVLLDLDEVLAEAAEDRIRANEIKSAVARRNRKRHLKMKLLLSPVRPGTERFGLRPELPVESYFVR